MKKLLTLALLASAWSALAATETAKTLKTSRPGQYEVETRYPRFRDRTPLIRLANRTIEQWAKKGHAGFIQEAKNAFKALEAGGSEPLAPYSHEVDYKLTYYYAPRLISVRFDSMEYRGGAHPISYYSVLNFGEIDGKAKRLTLGDFFRPGSGYRQMVSDAVIEKLKKKEGTDFVASGEVKSLNTEQLNRFSISRDGLTFLLNHYEAGPYSSGRFEIKLTPSELGPDFKKAIILGR